MGQYFSWVNFDKNEVIETWIWPNGQKLEECTYVGCEETDAALTMLAGEWAGDLVVFLGDYAVFKDETHPIRKEIEHRLKGLYVEEYPLLAKDITGRFDYAKTRPEWKHPVYGDDDEDEAAWENYDGPFDIVVQHYRYVINESKKVFVDRTRTAVRYIHSDGRIVRYDPVPSMMCSETQGLEYPESEIAGIWIGDIVRPCNDHPGDEYSEVGRNYSYWAPPIVNCTDEEILAVISANGLSLSDENLLEETDRCLSLRRSRNCNGTLS